MMRSYYQSVGPVELPFNNRQLYMAPIDLQEPLFPAGYTDYETVFLSLCDAVGAYSGTAYLTVDEKTLEAGETQRKPGPHVDGRFVPSMNRWGNGGWNHGCNVVPTRMGIIVASSVPLCKAWEGEYEGVPRLTGDCTHILKNEDVLDEGKTLAANIAYLFSPDCIHESLPAIESCKRTFMRIALPLSYHWTGGH